MLELQSLTVAVNEKDNAPVLLSNINARFNRGELCAIIGSSGSGKSTLIRAITGIIPNTDGMVSWDGVNLEISDLPPSEIGYAPQFTISQEHLTTRENIVLALKLRVAGISIAEIYRRTDELLDLTGLSSAADTLSKHLSGGQRRRLALCMELSSEPSLLLCDEVTSGLDAHSEQEILLLLQHIAHTQNRAILVVIHSLRDLHLFDKVAVMYEAHLAYFGSPDTAAHYFSVDTAEDIFQRLPTRSGEDWHNSWVKHHSHFQDEFNDKESSPTNPSPPSDQALQPPRQIQIASPLSQFLTLLATRWKIFFRDKGGIALQLGLVFGFPLVVAIFALDGLPNIPNLDTGLSSDVIRQMVEARTFAEGASKAGSVISGLVLLQVILLGLLGANNSAREIAGERTIFEKERFAGLSPAAYVASRVAFLAVLVLIQSAWMTWFVRLTSSFPGDGLLQFLFFLLVNAALTSVCLGISALTNSPDQASLASIYLVGFQLPLSGAVLAMPHAIGLAVRPFIAAYWSWSGALQSLHDTRYYDVLELVIPTTLSSTVLCIWVLILHIVFGIFLAWMGCLRSAWNRT